VPRSSAPPPPLSDTSNASDASNAPEAFRSPSDTSVLTDLLERMFPIGILALAIFGVPILVLEPEGLPRMRALEHELSDVTAENEMLRRSVGDLHGEVKRLRDDPAAVERIARDQLGLVRKSEIVFQFPRARDTQNVRGPNANEGAKSDPSGSSETSDPSGGRGGTANENENER
jgi:cell division protein FtsB